MMRFYICEHCGNIVTFVKSSGVPVMCCGQKMTELVPGHHRRRGGEARPRDPGGGRPGHCDRGLCGAPHDPEHFIEWDRPGDQGGVQIKHLTPGSKPQAVFALTQGDSVVSAYAYCNLHGLWKA